MAYTPIPNSDGVTFRANINDRLGQDRADIEALQEIVAGGNNGFNNKVINGCFRVNQRGVSGTVTLPAGVYGHDRWKAGPSGCTYTFSVIANVTTITITAGSLKQVIEGINLSSGVHTLRWAGTAQGRINNGSYSASGVTETIVGGNNTTVEFSTGTLSSVQFEYGTPTTSFEIRQIGTELVLCQRYYIRAGAGGFAYAISSTALGCQVSFPVEMRTTPTVTGISGSGVNLLVRIGGTYETVNTFAFIGPTLNRGCLMYGTGGGYTVGGYHIVANFAECSAEL